MRVRLVREDTSGGGSGVEALLCATGDLREAGLLPGQVVRVGLPGAVRGVVFAEAWPSRVVERGNAKFLVGGVEALESAENVVVERAKVEAGGLAGRVRLAAAAGCSGPSLPASRPAATEKDKEEWDGAEYMGMRATAGSYVGVGSVVGPGFVAERVELASGADVPEGTAVLVGESTQFYAMRPTEGDETTTTPVLDSADDPSTALEWVCEAFETPLRSLVVHSGDPDVGSCRGVLLEGDVGLGADEVASTLAHVLGWRRLSLRLASIVHTDGLEGSAEREASAWCASHFGKAADEAAPAVIVVDGLDTLGRSDAEGLESHREDRRRIAALGDVIDTILSRCRGVCVAPVTSRTSVADSLLARPRFGTSVVLMPPTTPERRAMLQALCVRLGLPLDPALAVWAAQHVGSSCGWDALARVASEAALHRAVRAAVESREAAHGWQRSDFVQGAVWGSGMAGDAVGTVSVPTTRWADIGGMWETKAAVREAVEWPLRCPALFTGLGVSPPRGALLFGPPGCSKTMVARALATSAGLAFLHVKGPELLSKYVGDAERAIASLFSRARRSAPCLVFLDEVDALAPPRGSRETSSGSQDRLVNQLLQELDGFSSGAAAGSTGIAVLAATNRPDLVDPALLRPGRLERLLFVPPPDADSRAAILRAGLAKLPHHSIPDDVVLLAANEWTKGFSGAEVASSLRAASSEAVSLAIRTKTETETETEAETLRPNLTPDLLESACAAVRPQITATMLHTYRTFRETRS